VTVVNSDSFNRSNRNLDADALDNYAGGAADTWSDPQAAFTVSGNQIVTVSGAVSACRVATANVADVAADAKLNNYPGGAAIRMAAGGGAYGNGYAGYYNGTTLIFKLNFGGSGLTVLASSGSGFALGHRIGVRGSGTTIILTIDGIDDVSAVDASFASGSYGLFSAGVNAQLDDFQAATAAPPPPPSTSPPMLSHTIRGAQQNAALSRTIHA
jgi:hypothetical protein